MPHTLSRAQHLLRRLFRFVCNAVKLVLYLFKALRAVVLSGRHKTKPVNIAPSHDVKRKGKRKPEWVMREVLRLKALMPSAGCRYIAKVFNRIHTTRRKESVSRNYVAYTVRDHCYEILELRRKFKHRIPYPGAVNRTWAIDLCGKGDVLGANHPILGIVDHGSRKLLELEAPDNKNAWTLLGYLFIAIGRFGKPRAVRTDNEAVFKSRVFKTGLALAGIRQQFITPGCPWMNGRIERLFGTLKTHLDKIKIDGKEALAQLMSEFQFWYNTVRPHQHLNGRTPNEVWTGVDPYAKAPKSAQWYEGWNGMLRGYYLRY